MGNDTRMRAARALERGGRGAERWAKAWGDRVRETAELYRRTLTEPSHRRPTPKHFARLAADWLALPFETWLDLGDGEDDAPRGPGNPDAASPPRSASGAVSHGSPLRGLAHWVSGDWVVDGLAASVDWWASVLGCAPDDDLAFDLDDAAEMTGPGRCRLPSRGLQVSSVTDLVHDTGQGKIDASHVVARIMDDELLVSLVDLSALQSSLPLGVYRGTATLSSGLTLPISATKAR